MTNSTQQRIRVRRHWYNLLILVLLGFLFVMPQVAFAQDDAQSTGSDASSTASSGNGWINYKEISYIDDDGDLNFTTCAIINSAAAWKAYIDPFPPFALNDANGTYVALSGEWSYDKLEFPYACENLVLLDGCRVQTSHIENPGSMDIHVGRISYTGIHNRPEGSGILEVTGIPKDVDTAFCLRGDDKAPLLCIYGGSVTLKNTHGTALAVGGSGDNRGDLIVRGGSLTASGEGGCGVDVNNLTVSGGTLEAAGTRAGIMTHNDAAILGGETIANGTGSSGVAFDVGRNLKVTNGTVTATGSGGGIVINRDAPQGAAITISGGTVKGQCTGSKDESVPDGPGIGGCSANGCDVRITGATVEGISINGAGIGGPESGDAGVTVAIQDGTVTGQSVKGAGVGGGCRDSSKMSSVSITNGTVLGISQLGAGIGGGDGGESCDVTISNGTVTATSVSGAGIGGGMSGNGGTVTIAGGRVTANAADEQSGFDASGAAIGGGNECTGYNVVIRGDNTMVRAEAKSTGAGIGGGERGKRGTVTIEAGTVYATCTGSGACIGSGSTSEPCDVSITGGTVNAGWFENGGQTDGAGIGGGEYSKAGRILIKAGNVSALSAFGGAGIGGGYGADGGTVSITGGVVTAWSQDEYGDGHAIGRGADAEKAGTIEFGYMEVVAGSDKDHAQYALVSVDSDEREDACHNNAWAKVVLCDHTKADVYYTPSAGWTTIEAHCTHCGSYRYSERHQFQTYDTSSPSEPASGMIKCTDSGCRYNIPTTVKLATKNATYDGKAHGATIKVEGPLEPNLIDTEMWYERMDGTELKDAPTEAGTYKAHAEFSVIIAPFFAISSLINEDPPRPINLFTTYEIAPRPVAVQPVSQVILSGKAIKQGIEQVALRGIEGQAESGLLAGHKLLSVTLKPGGAITKSCEIKASDAKIANAAGKDVTANYDPRYQDGWVDVVETIPDFTEPKPLLGLTYDGKDKPLLSPGSSDEATIEYATSRDGTYTTGVPTGKAAGTYTVWWRLVYNSNDPESVSAITAQAITVTIAPRTAKLEWSNTSFAYDGAYHTPTCAVTNLVKGDACEIVVSGEQRDAGSHTATADATTNSNYALRAGANLSCNYTISQREVKVQDIRATDKVYDGTTTAMLSFEYVKFESTVEGQQAVIDGDVLSVTCTGTYLNERTDKPDASVTANTPIALSDYALTGDDARNYKLSQKDSQQYTAAAILPRPVVVQALNQVILDTGEPDLSISKAKLVSGEGYPLIDGHTLSGITITADGWTAGATDEFDLVPSNATITDGEQDVSRNYSIEYVNGMLLTMDTGPVFTPPTPIPTSYDGTAQDLVFPGKVEAGYSMLYSLDDSNEWSTRVPQATDAGDYTVWYIVQKNTDTANGGTGVGLIPKQCVHVTIYRFPITIRPYDGQKKVYGSADPELEYNDYVIYGMPPLVGKLERQRGESVGSYAIRQGTITEENNPNYHIDFCSGVNFTITKREVKIEGITVADKVYDGTTTATLDCENAEVIDYDTGDKITDGLSVRANGGTFDSANAGTYDVNLYDLSIGGYNASNYKLVTYASQKTAIGNILQRPVSVCPADQVVLQNQPLKQGVSYATLSDVDGEVESGPLAGHRLLAVTFAPSGGLSQSCAITASDAKISDERNQDVTANYQISYQKAWADVMGSAPEYTAPVSKSGLIYSGVGQELVTAGSVTTDDYVMQYSLTGGADESDWSSNVPKGTDAGDYTVWWRLVPTSNDQNLQAINKQKVYASIARRAVTVTPKENQGKTYGDPDPTLTYDVDYHLQAGEDAEAMAPLAGELGRMKGEDAGTYDITQGTIVNDAKNDRNPNYRVYFASGKYFTIAKRRITVSGIKAKNKVYDGSTAATLDFSSVTIQGQVATDKLTVNANGTFADANVGTGKNVNVSGLTLDGTNARNYDVQLDPQNPTASITQRPVIVQAHDQTILDIEEHDATASAVTLVAQEGYPLINGHMVTGITIVTNPVRAQGASGTFGLVPSNATISMGGDNVTGNYNIRYVDGQLLAIAASPDFTPPQAKSLVYNGKDQELVVPGTTDPGYTMLYSLTGGSNDDWSSQVPSGKDADEYTVWYVVRKSGEANEANGELGLINKQKVRVTISRRPVTVEPKANQSKTYGNKDPETFAFDVKDQTGATITSDAQLLGTLTREQGEVVGTYAITQGTVTDKKNDNYLITFTNGVSFAITAREVTVSGIKAQNKVYDGTTTATLDFMGAELDGKLKDDELEVSATGAFEDANAGSNKHVGLSALALGGNDARNYVLASSGQQTSANANITKRPVAVCPKDQIVLQGASLKQGKEYAELHDVEGKVPSGALAGHTLLAVTLAPSGELSESCAITASEAKIGDEGNQDVTANYQISYQEAWADVMGTVPEFTPPQAKEDLVYDGTEIELVTEGTSTQARIEYARTKDGQYSTDVPTGKDVGTYTVWWRVVRNNSQDPVGSIAAQLITVSIAPRQAQLAWSDTTFTYDGQQHVSTCTVSNLVSGDECTVTVNGAQKDAGTYTATATALSNSNYALPAGSALTSEFTISQRAVKVGGIKAQNKVYDTTVTATLDFADVTIDNKIEGDVLFVTASGTFEEATAGMGRTVNLSALALGGSDARNYELSNDCQTSATANILQRPITVEAHSQSILDTDAPVTDKSAVSLMPRGGYPLIEGHELSGVTVTTKPVWTAGASGTFDLIPSDAVIFNGLVDVSNNYDVQYVNGTLFVMATVPPFTPPKAKSLTYDGTNQALVEAGSILGTGYTMLYSLTGGANDDWSDTVPTRKDAGDYTVWYIIRKDGAQSNDTGLGIIGKQSVKVRINRHAVTVTPKSGQNKTYGDADPALEYNVANMGDSMKPLVGTLARATGEGVGSYAILQGSITNEQNPNYLISFTEGKTFDIEKRPVTVLGIAAQDKVYDGTTVATLDFAGMMLNGKVDGDSLTASATGTFEDANAGANKPVVISNIKLTGGDAHNYMLAESGQQESAQANIQKRPATVQPSDQVILSGQSIEQGVSHVTLQGNGTSQSGPVKGHTLTEVTLEPSTAITETCEITASGAKICDGSGLDVTANYELTYGKATASVMGTLPDFTAPQPIVGLEYDGKAQALITEGSVQGEYTMQYSLTGGEDEEWSTEVPKGTDAQTYTVWWRLEPNGNDQNLNAITKQSLTVGIAQRQAELAWSDDSFVYDGQNRKPACSVANLAEGDSCDVTVAGEQKDAGSYTATATGLSNNNYALWTGAELTHGFTIDRRPVTVLGIAAAHKVYDGDTTATLDYEAMTIEGKVEGDVLSASATGAFADAKVGENKNVALSALTLSGDAACNYKLSDDCQSSTTANITQRPVAVCPSDQVVLRGHALVQDVSRVVLGSVEGETPSGAVMGHVLADITLLPSGKLINSCDIEAINAKIVSGNEDVTANYELHYQKAQANVVDTVPDFVPPQPQLNLVYDGTDQELVIAGSSDEATIQYALAAPNTAPQDEDYGTDVPKATAAGNYTVWWRVLRNSNSANNDEALGAIPPQRIQVSIGRRPITIIPTEGQQKTYGEEELEPYGYYVENWDSSTMAPLQGAIDRVHGANVGAYPFTQGTLVSGYSTSSSFNPNYLISFASGAHYTIRQRPVTVSGITAADKVYDGTTDVVIDVTGASLIEDDILDTDKDKVALDTTASTGAFVDATVGNDKQVNVNNVILTGEAAYNYVLHGSQVVRASITARPAKVVANDQVCLWGDKLRKGTSYATVESLDGHEQSGAAPGQSLADITLAPQSVVKSAGVITPSNAIIADASGNDVTDNYDLKYEDGMLLVMDVLPNFTPPVANEGLVYDGTKHKLVTPGTTERGVIVYALSENGEFSTSVPTRKAAGTYEVWWKIVDEDDFSVPIGSIRTQCLTVTVRQRVAELSWTGTEWWYDGSKHIPVAKATNLVKGDTCDVTVDGAQKAVGKHTATATALSNDNYVLPKDASTTFVIKRAQQKIQTDIIIESGAPQVSSSNFDDIAQLFVTDRERGLAASGVRVRVWMQIKVIEEAELGDENVAAFNERLKALGATAGQYLDISIYKQVGDEVTRITKTPKPVRLAITVPDALRKEKRTHYLVRAHDGKATVNAKTRKTVLSGKSSLFSPYLLAYVDPANPSEKTPQKPAESSTQKPQTNTSSGRTTYTPASSTRTSSASASTAKTPDTADPALTTCALACIALAGIFMLVLGYVSKKG